MREVLIVVDMQKGFLEPGRPLYCGDEARQSIPRVAELVKEKQEQGATVIFTQDTHDPDDKEFEMFPPHCLKGTEEAELIDELKDFDGIRMQKARYSTFFGTNLEEILDDLRPDRVTVCGVCTHICVMHTVADLRARDYPVVVPRDCVASFDRDAHEFALTHMEKVLGAKVTGGERL
jgi:nicotinamidase-related amidase